MAGLVAFLCVLVAASAAPAQTAQAPNAVRLEMRTPRSAFNRLLVTVTVCLPGTKQCETIPDVMVDTGSTGLRLERFAVPAAFRLPAFTGLDGHPLAECVRFVHDSAWGDLFRADLHIGGMMAANLPIQIIGAGTDHHHESCAPSGADATSNGTLGIGTALTDCDGACKQSATSPTVFTCKDDGCTPIEGPVPPALRLPNPVSRFLAHNNGIVFDLPAAPATGAKSVVGTLTFGIGTAADNAPGAAQILQLNANAEFATVYEGRTYPDSYIDSGTETYVVPDDRVPRCAGMQWAFCAAPPVRRSATMTGRDGTSFDVSFDIGDYRDVQTLHVGVSSNIAIAAPTFTRTFVWGAPFFLGKHIFVLMTGQSIPGADRIVGPAYGIRTYPNIMEPP